MRRLGVLVIGVLWTLGLGGPLAGPFMGLAEAQAPAQTAAPTTAQAAATVPAVAPSQIGGDPTESAAYKALIEEAVREYAAQNFPEARSLFTRAFALSPNARVLRGLGMAEFELRNYPRSVDYLRRALASADHPLSGDLRASAEALLLRAERFVVAVPLSITPPDAVLLVDGQPATRGEDGALVMQVGDHTVEFTAPGYRSQRRKVSVTGAQPAPVEVVLEAANLAVAGAGEPQGAPAPGPTAAALVATGPDAEKDDSSLFESPLLWAGVGVGVAVIAVVLVASLSGSDGGGVRDPIASDPALTLTGP